MILNHFKSSIISALCRKKIMTNNINANFLVEFPGGYVLLEDIEVDEVDTNLSPVRIFSGYRVSPSKFSYDLRTSYRRDTERSLVTCIQTEDFWLSDATRYLKKQGFNFSRPIWEKGMKKL